MTIERAEWAPFHVGLVVRDIDAVVAAYGRVLGVPAWSRYDVEFPAVPFDPASTDSLLKVALGKGAGMTWEVIQVASGDCVQGRWLAEHGEGVHHLGFWVTDLQAAVTDAVDAGAGIEWATLRADGSGAVHLKPGSGAADIIPGLEPDRMAYLGLGVGGVTFELCGRAHYGVMQARTGGDPHGAVTPPPWLANLGWG